MYSILEADFYSQHAKEGYETFMKEIFVIDAGIIINVSNILQHLSFILELYSKLQKQPKLDEFPIFDYNCHYAKHNNPTHY